MKALLRFFIHFRVFFLFLALEIISLILIVKHNQFQRSAFLNSSNAVMGKIYETSNNVYEYFGLKGDNLSLAHENTELKQKLYTLETELNFLKQDTSYQGRKQMAIDKKYTFITAKVINATTNKLKNFITLDKGRLDGIKEEMGVINEHGIVGIVSSVSDHFSVVLPIINPSSRISAKVKDKNQTGSVIWEGADERIALLEEVPLYIPVHVGDTVVSSGYSSIFPEGIDIGKVKVLRKENDNYFYIEIELLANFNKLSYVDVIDFKNAEEEKGLEEETRKEAEK
ncbi:MAG TPA: rod shape-determining protein MreC [Paludibacteraceae bacterium]|nr:rod shape-determining protein MreC [Paludibacteraceae bacterium]HPH62660.1 rod shape-determining protein MreC [Paludibacteraceae bacterium]